MRIASVVLICFDSLGWRFVDAVQYSAGSAEQCNNVSRRVIKPVVVVVVLVFTEGHIFIPFILMHGFDTPVRTVESQYPVGFRVLNPKFSIFDKHDFVSY